MTRLLDRSRPKKKNGLDTPAKKSVQTVEETPMKEMLPMQHTTNYPTAVREPVGLTEKLDVTVPRLLEVPGPILTPPAEYTPDYFVNEFAKEPVREFVGYSAPDIERPGYKLQRSWAPEEGVTVWIDHLGDEPFTVPEIRDLITTLTFALDLVDDSSPSPEVQGSMPANACNGARKTEKRHCPSVEESATVSESTNG